MIDADDRRTRRRLFPLALLLAGIFGAFHVPFLPQSLEDLDSINFALGMQRFDVAHHQPHPPGYPLFILLARGVQLIVRTEVTALAVLSIIAGAAGALAIVALHRRMFTTTTWPWSIAAAAIAVTSPLYWLTASRPLSDMTGLAAAISVQVATLAACTTSGARRLQPSVLVAAAFVAGLATGIRSQVFWLTVPLLSWKVARDCESSGHAERGGGRLAAAFAVGVLMWLLPLIVLSGGPHAYWQALSSQGGEDLSGIQMLWTTPTVRTLVDALYFELVAPWALWPPALAILASSALGVVALWRGERRQLEMLAVAFVPYLVFDILFQETFTSRYALPLVIPLAFAAARGLQTFPPQPAIVALTALIMWNAHVGGRSVAALGSEPAPVFQLLADMKAASAGGALPALAPDRRLSFDLRRPFAWEKDQAPPLERQLPSPPQHEWLEAVRYWNGGGRAPLWFVVDPHRAAIDLVQHDRPSRYRFTMPYPVLMSGTRPGDADWYRVDRPDWYVGEGWALTPESAGVAEQDHHGLQYGPVGAWVHRSAISGGGFLMGGRNFEPTEGPAVTISLDGIWSKTEQVRPGGFVDLVRLPFLQLDASVPEYVNVVISSQPAARVAIEQFDLAPPARAVIGFGEGWHERELDTATGRQWRWLSDRGELPYVAPATPGGWRLHVEGESPLRYYAKPSHIVVKSGERVLQTVTADADFSFDVEVPPAHLPSTLVIETDQTHVPADSWWRRSHDRRSLGLRIFRCELRPASAPDRAASSPPAR
ncbi:MAG TPA: hypothetical protein VF219_12655 [Vicinamibacterales bacterium]